jgi:hypothetical protein
MEGSTCPITLMSLVHRFPNRPTEASVGVLKLKLFNPQTEFLSKTTPHNHRSKNSRTNGEYLNSNF